MLVDKEVQTMVKEIKVLVDENLLLRFNMAMQLNGDEIDGVFDDFIKNYVANSFSKEAFALRADSTTDQDGYLDSENPFAGKALQKISKWARKPSQINYKIMRAYLQLLEEHGSVSYAALANLCGDLNHPDVYVSTFSTNFAQMKFDGEKSHGKVFITDEDDMVYIWEYVEGEVMKYKEEFKKVRSTDTGFVNTNNQQNFGKTDMNGTDHGQKLYMMHCNECGNEYFANGSDIHLKKCPKCQGGKNTGIE